jgi:hypothetical protein
MRTVTVFAAILCVVTPALRVRARTGGPCTEAAIKQQRLAAAADVYTRISQVTPSNSSRSRA